MILQAALLERYCTNVSNMELMFFTYIPGGNILERCLNCNILSNFFGGISKIGYFQMNPPKFYNY